MAVLVRLVYVLDMFTGFSDTAIVGASCTNPITKET